MDSNALLADLGRLAGLSPTRNCGAFEGWLVVPSLHAVVALEGGAPDGGIWLPDTARALRRLLAHGGGRAVDAAALRRAVPTHRRGARRPRHVLARTVTDALHCAVDAHRLRLVHALEGEVRAAWLLGWTPALALSGAIGGRAVRLYVAARIPEGDVVHAFDPEVRDA